MKIGGKQTLGIAAIEILTKHRSVRVVWRYGQQTMYILILFLFFPITTGDLFYSCD